MGRRVPSCCTRRIVAQPVRPHSPGGPLRLGGLSQTCGAELRLTRECRRSLQLLQPSTRLRTSFTAASGCCCAAESLVPVRTASCSCAAVVASDRSDGRYLIAGNWIGPCGGASRCFDAAPSRLAELKCLCRTLTPLGPPPRLMQPKALRRRSRSATISSQMSV